MTVWAILEWVEGVYFTRHLCKTKEVAQARLMKYIEEAHSYDYFESEDPEEEYNKYVDIITNWKTKKSSISQKTYVSVWNYQACEMTIEEE